MYLGEIVRLILVDCIEQRLLFTGQQIQPRFLKAHEFLTAYLSNIETDTYPFPKTSEILRNFGIDSTTEERQFVFNITQCVSSRAALLCSLQIAACVQQMEKETEHVIVAVDGSVYHRYPGFSEKMKQNLRVLGLHKIEFVVPTDGSGLGAALASYMIKNLF